MALQAPGIAPAESEVLKGGLIGGSILSAHMNFVHEAAGNEGVRAVRTLLAERYRGEIPGIFHAMSQQPFALLVALDRAIEEIYRSLVPDVYLELGRHSARANHARNLTGLDRLSVQRYFERSAKTFPQFQTFATASFTQHGPGSAEFRHIAPRNFSPVHCRSTLGYYEQCILLHGGKDARVVERTCRCLKAPDCIFDFTWKEGINE